MTDEHRFTLGDILDVLPHREPFLFVDRVVSLQVDRRIVTERTVRDDEPYLKGHFPGEPIMPGVLVTDALAQTAGLLWGLSKKVQGDDGDGVPRAFLLAAANVKFVNPALPGETLRMTAEPEQAFGAFYSYRVSAQVGKKMVTRGTLTLAMREGNP